MLERIQGMMNVSGSFVHLEPNGYGLHMYIKENKAQHPYVHTRGRVRTEKKGPVRAHPSGRARTEKKQTNKHYYVAILAIWAQVLNMLYRECLSPPTTHA